MPFGGSNSRKIFKTASNENSTVRCASLNKSSLQSFVTGHESGTVQLWRIHNNKNTEPLCIFESNSSVTCVAFNAQEPATTTAKTKTKTTSISNVASTSHTPNSNWLITGNIGGGIKIYDLAERKLLRNYGAHRSEITDLDFFCAHHGNTLIISCSTDSNVKIWDLRSKNNALTLKGHCNTVNCLDVSPDGNWMVSADCVGHTRLWDIRTAKCVHQFHDTQSIHDVLFHPDELVLATASGKAVRFWDLESMTHIQRTSKVSTPIQKLMFPQQAAAVDKDEEAITMQYVVAAATQSLRIWRWDPLPMHCATHMVVHWSKIADMQQMLGYNDLICLEMEKHQTVVWLTDLGQVLTSLSPSTKSTDGCGHDGIDNEQKEETPTIVKITPAPKEETETDSYDDEFEEIDDEDIPNEMQHIQVTTKGGGTCTTATAACPNHEDTELKEQDTPGCGEDDNNDVQVPEGLKCMPQELWTQSFVNAADTIRKQRQTKVFLARKQLRRSPTKLEGMCDTSNNDKKIENENEADQVVVASENDVLNKSDSQHTHLKFGAFIPRHLADYDERELVKIKRTMMGEHIPTLRMLSARLRYLRQLKSSWKKKKLTEFIDILQQLQNDTECKGHSLFIGVIQSILKDINLKSFSFRFCYLLLSVIDLHKLNTTDEHIPMIIVVLQYMKHFLSTFTVFIINTLQTRVINEKDLSMIDRRTYCQNALDLVNTDVKLFLFKVQNIDQLETSHVKLNESCLEVLSLVDQLQLNG